MGIKRKVQPYFLLGFSRCFTEDLLPTVTPLFSLKKNCSFLKEMRWACSLVFYLKVFNSHSFPFPSLNALNGPRMFIFISHLQRQRFWATMGVCLWRSSCPWSCTQRLRMCPYGFDPSVHMAFSWQPPPGTRQTPSAWSWTQGVWNWRST